MRACSVGECGRKHYAKGMCASHYARYWRGTLDDSPIRKMFSDPEEAFQARTQWNEEMGCLEWTGAKTSQGYGNMRVNGENKPAHRYAWERENGTVPQGFDIDHICHNRTCVNAEHLRVATRSDNLSHRRGPQSNNRLGVRNVKELPSGNFYVEVKGRGFGTYPTLKEAEVAAGRARDEMLGEFSGKG